VRATRGYATPATWAPPPLALKNNLTDTKNKTHPNKKTKVWAMLGNCPDKQTDTIALIYKIEL